MLKMGENAIASPRTVAKEKNILDFRNFEIEKRHRVFFVP